MCANFPQRGIFIIALALSVQLSAAQDFHKNYPLSAGGQIIIGNNLGNIKVTGYKGDSIEVLASRRGSEHEGDAVEIADNSSGDRIELFPKHGDDQSRWAVVDFEVRVPSAMPFNFSRLSSFAGNVEVSNVNGRIRAESVKGNVEVKDVTGLVSASSVSGEVFAEIGQARGRNNMRFWSISGNIKVLAPPQLDALIDMSSSTGALRTDFPIEIQERRYGPGRMARGRLGLGSQILHITSVSGSVNLLQK
jgi:hypothetical protein